MRLGGIVVALRVEVPASGGDNITAVRIDNLDEIGCGILQEATPLKRKAVPGSRLGLEGGAHGPCDGIRRCDEVVTGRIQRCMGDQDVEVCDFKWLKLQRHTGLLLLDNGEFAGLTILIGMLPVFVLCSVKEQLIFVADAQSRSACW